jgi:hypothetical protein
MNQTSVPYQASYTYNPTPYALGPPPSQWDWRDYFVRLGIRDMNINRCHTQITAVFSGTIAYGAAALFRVCHTISRFKGAD